MLGTLWACWQTIKSNTNLLALTGWLALLIDFFAPQMLVVWLGVLMPSYASLLWLGRSARMIKNTYWLICLWLSSIVMELQLLIIMLLEF